MDTLSFIGPLMMVAGVGVLALVAVAIVQDMRQERKYGYRQAFYTIVSLLMLVMTIGSLVSLLVIGLKETVLPTAKEYNQRYNTPPTFYLTGNPTDTKFQSSQPYACTTDCEMTAADKQSFADLKTSYANWQSTSTYSIQTRRAIAGALAILIIALPLYLLFINWMNKGAAEEYAVHPKPSPLRSVYYYGVAFAGLVTAVVGGAMLINTVLNVALKVDTANKNTMPIPTVGGLYTETALPDSVIACEKNCGFTADDVAVAKAWKKDWQTYRDRQNSNTGATANDLATTIPLVLVGIPLFWYHFARIRKETQKPPVPTGQPIS